MKFPCLKSHVGVGFPGSGSSGALQTVLGLGAGNGRDVSLGQKPQGLQHQSALPQFPRYYNSVETACRCLSLWERDN